MKRNQLYILALLMLVITAGACKKFLERPPQGQMSREDALTDVSRLESFANGFYTLLGDGDFMGGRYQVLNSLLGDQFKGDKFTGDYAEIYKRQNSFFGGTRDAFYSKGYTIINRSNVLLENLGLATEPSKYKTLEGVAKFFRGVMHFELVRMFAQPYGYTADNSQLGIPLRIKVSLASQQRATVQEVYDQVIADLKAADSLLPADPANGKYTTATKWAAKAYLAKVYFQMNNFPQAFNYADQVIKSGKFQLDTDYNNRFSADASGNTLSKEAILWIPTITGQYEVGGELRGAFRSDQAPPSFTLTDQFYNAATARGSDVRKAWYSNTLQPGLNVLTKFNKNFFALPIIHLTEIKLIRAESGAEMGGANLATAITDINDILTRAYGGTANNLPANATASLVINTVRTERELELVGEGNRVNEIKRIGARSGVNVDRRGSPWNCPGFILQFPKSESDANTAFQMNPEGGCF